MKRTLRAWPLSFIVAIAATACHPDGSGRPEARVAVAAVRSDTTKRFSLDEVTALREEGPAGLAKALARFDALPAGAERDALATQIDRIAGQRYATSSRLYWYTDLEQAKAAAWASGKPILSLRMLGRLDEDYSCANSRFFRVALYANAAVSAVLRDQFVLHWSSERPVPRLTVDFGDGRTLHGTIAGNSAHYVLDADGRPLDVLPGLYGPERFRAALEDVSVFARRLAARPPEQRAERLRAFHRARQSGLEQTWSRERVLGIDLAGAAPVNAPTPAKAGANARAAAPPIADAEILAISKMRVEYPVVRGAQLGGRVTPYREDGAMRERVAASPLWRAHLDEGSRRLIVAIGPTDWGAAPSALQGTALDQLIGGFERELSVDQFFNEFDLHWQIHRWFAAGEVTDDWSALNQRVYAQLFLTPAQDPWLGMAPHAFTGLPGDGLAHAPSPAK